ncbi:19877_t:CDS:2 [Dentiscutata erythropus]|uniref:19877_t:CDS:1 n=1 Tax=Dentiscutata erythropus TaxID=1348616 RepID=A0A9N9H2A6_9GLOM|nr:19877_t:CDS:2 [Dentiscutata erythropus]
MTKLLERLSCNTTKSRRKRVDGGCLEYPGCEDSRKLLKDTVDESRKAWLGGVASYPTSGSGLDDECISPNLRWVRYKHKISPPSGIYLGLCDQDDKASPSSQGFNSMGKNSDAVLSGKISIIRVDTQPNPSSNGGLTSTTPSGVK